RAPLGGVAQLVAHLLCKQGVRGSSPLASTPGQRPFPLVGEGLFRARTPAKYGSKHAAQGCDLQVCGQQGVLIVDSALSPQLSARQTRSLEVALRSEGSGDTAGILDEGRGCGLSRREDCFGQACAQA